MQTPDHKTISRLPASRFPNPAEGYFCDNCGRDLTRELHHDQAPVWQPLRPIWYVCRCGRKYLSGAAEWDDLTARERYHRIRQLSIGFALFALLVTPVTLAYFALRYGGTALIAVVAIALIPSILVARPFWFVLVDLYEIIASVWRTRIGGRKALPGTATTPLMKWSRLRKLRLTPVGVAIAVLIVASRWIPSHIDAASPGGAASRETSSAVPQETFLAPVKLSVLPTMQSAVTGAPSRAFKRLWVAPNEVDYIAEDVTIRNFNPTLVSQRKQAAYREVRVGADVTIRYFASKPASPRTSPQLPDLSLVLAK